MHAMVRCDALMIRFIPVYFVVCCVHPASQIQPVLRQLSNICYTTCVTYNTIQDRELPSFHKRQPKENIFLSFFFFDAI